MKKTNVALRVAAVLGLTTTVLSTAVAGSHGNKKAMKASMAKFAKCCMDNKSKEADQDKRTAMCQEMAKLSEKKTCGDVEKMKTM